ncbi:MAG: TlpA family protein disulfide reductase [Rhodospirillales bacterium]|nr:TlpA family protein disulfide reductase [Rhodospirillales bacterium]
MKQGLNAMAAAVFILAVLASPSYTVPAQAGSADKAAARPPAPDVTFLDSSGATQSLSRYRGKVVLVNLWATWCAPCIREMPSLDQLQRQLGALGFEVLALSQDRGGIDTIRKFYEKQSLKYLKPLADPKGQAAQAFGARGLPTSYLIDSRGRMVGQMEGATQWDGPEAMALIKEVINGL